MKHLFFIIFSLLTLASTAQKLGVFVLAKDGTASLRGMSIPSDDVIWVSGSNGTVGRSTDGGKSWQWIIVKDFEKSDFRDIEAFDSMTAVIMAVADPAYILKTKDGGKTWNVVYKKSLPGMFLDAMDFKGKEGICIGDPVAIGGGGRKFFFVVRTHDGGDTWQDERGPKLPPASQNGEGIFAASGTNIALLDNPNYDYAFISGGVVSNIYFMGREGKPNKKVEIPINQGVENAGAFSMATDGKKKFYCIGGDYKIVFSTYDNFYFTIDEGGKWASPSKAPPFGYRSCIKLIDKDKMVACGSNGVDYCKDGGNDWVSVTKEGFNVCMVSPNKKIVFLAGDNGKVGRLQY
jgi:photosystem II stability/assembly factor-like uncharacterized protein